MGIGLESGLDMDFLEKFLAEDEDNLCSYTSSDLENVVQLLMEEIQSQQDKLEETQADLQNMEAEVTESARRELFTSSLAQTFPQREALEEEVRTREQLLTVTKKIERLSDTRGAESCGALKMRLMEAEGVRASCRHLEKSFQEKLETLRATLGKSEAQLGETMAELQTVESELLAVQTRVSAQRPAQEEAAQVISACMAEMGLLPAEKQRKN
ncbi:uncharacterized protein ACNLHF_026406 isoform 2-T2 [Anomaloglossus baeobatrachus]|uniref:uncharacterized protein LOC142245800 isoform X2 n=1 Tax=Anomaloglossus baeobatrachus TaxID=238106 RepID=UPI003F50341D